MKFKRSKYCILFTALITALLIQGAGIVEAQTSRGWPASLLTFGFEILKV